MMNFCVEKTEDGKVMGCHKTEDDAFAQMRALYAEKMTIKTSYQNHQNFPSNKDFYIYLYT